jgi:hypothetical protein
MLDLFAWIDIAGSFRKRVEEVLRALSSRTSVTSGMSRRVKRGTLPSVLITIRTTGDEPLEGEAAAEDGPAVPFVGWLGLLRTLSQLLVSGGDRAPDRFGGQLDAR